MTSGSRLPDQQDRDVALDPRRSFIVQAPAGSGKTELLIQRFLRLLACVEQPEEVIAVTFTRKAAGEMRSRVIAAILQAEAGSVPEQPHLRRSYELAREILADERRRDWQLHRHPARLSISTIDAVNAWLAGRAPIGAGSGALQRVTDSPESLYRDAARSTLALVAEDDELGLPVAALLGHLDNDVARFERLITAMLPRREQWLRHVLAAGDDRAALEQPLRDLVAHVLAQAASQINDDLAASLTRLLACAGSQLRERGRASAVTTWAGRATFPAADPQELPAWKAMAAILLTADGEWRRSVTVNDGFPPGTAEKPLMMELLKGLSGRDELRDRLRDVAGLPGPAYEDGQWAILRHLLAILPLAAAQLRLVFAARGEIDFAEVAGAAMDALGGAETPSELGLALDHRIGHILVDEFQDTSQSQFDLLRLLTAGWEPGDGRTVFIVGDPMQSIYRFREADVSLFMRVRDEGIGDLRPESLRLRANFRSQPEIVAWTNEVFGRIFPESDDALLGAVRFADSLPARAPSHGAVALVPAVQWHWLPAGDIHAEALRVAEIVTATRNAGPKAGVCILVRSRSHAGRILDALRSNGIAFVAPEIEDMSRATVAQDLLTLTRALTHPADRLAWIGVLRAPWCGLSLADLHALLAADHASPVADILRDESRRSLLSDPGAAAVTRLLGVLDRAGRARGRRPLRDLVEGAWLDLGGPAAVREGAELETAEEFLRLVESVDAGGDCPDAVWLGEQMSRRKGSLGSGEPGVQVMTMHKAKGLEFDVVILPGLARPPRGNEAPVLAWQEIRTGPRQTAPILAPIAPSGAESDALHAYLSALDRRKDACESDRLLYVACTRARHQLHLLGQIVVEHDEDTGEASVKAPRSGSLLQRLWPAVAAGGRAAARHMPPRAAAADAARVWVQPLIRRLPPGWQAPASAEPLRLRGSAPGVGEPLAYEWVSGWAMHVGSVVHRWLQIIAVRGADKFDERRLHGLRPRFMRTLEQLGTGTPDLERAADRVAAALTATLADVQGRWMLSSDHAEAASELPLTVCDGDRFRQVVIDRTFVDSGGDRWIIDSKTSTHEGGDLEAFLRLESERHGEQLRRYREAFAALDGRSIRTALYFPLLTAFREVRPDGPP